MILYPFQKWILPVKLILNKDQLNRLNIEAKATVDKTETSWLVIQTITP